MTVTFMKKLLVLFVAILCSVCSWAQNPPLTPAWAFGHIVWEDSLNTTRGVERIVGGYLDRQIPVNAVIVDSPWSNSYNDFEWDLQRYSDPAAMIARMKSKGVKVILWMTGNINLNGNDTRLQKSLMYDYVKDHNYGVNGSQPYKWWKGEGLHLDFTNPKAVEWWYSQLDKAFVDGVYGWKVDQGEFWLSNVVNTSKGNMSNEKFRPYYYDAMFDYTTKNRKDGIIIARPYSHQGGFAASISKLNMGWCGDFAGNWAGLKEQISNIYISSLHGYGAVACEVAGFYKSRASSKEFVRYAQFGCMTACMINGGENGAFTNHLPWFHGKQVEEIYRYCVVLHKELVPYMFSTVVDAHQRGGSLIKNASLGEESHQLGDYIFTKAITDSSDVATFTLPVEGEWIDFWTGSRHNAGSTVSRKFNIEQFPLYIKAGAIIPLDIDDRQSAFGNTKLKGDQTIGIWPSGKAQRVLHLPDGEGVDYHDCRIEFDQQDSILNVENSRNEKIVIILNGVNSVSAVDGAADWHYDSAKKRLEICVSGEKAHVQLSAIYKN